MTLADAHDHVHAGAQLLLQRTAGLTLAYVPRGPLTDWHDVGVTTSLLNAIRMDARRAGAAILKIEPDLPDTAQNRVLLRSYGFTPSRQAVQPPSTIVVDIEGQEDAILQRMKSKWRYNIRLAERKGVTVRAMARADLPAFDALTHLTGQRDGFAVHSPTYFAAAFDLLTPDHAVFLLAEFAGEPLAAIVVATAGATACYLWGASSDRERNRMPNHALQWAGMRWAREHGATRYDLWGIPDDIGRLAAALQGGDGRGVASDALPIDLDALPAGGLWGVYRFKQGFGGDVVRAVGAWDLPLETVGFGLYQFGLVARARWDAAKQAQKLLQTVAQRRQDARQDEMSGTGTQVRAVAGAADWRAVLAGLPDPHVLQSWEWGQVKAQTGWHAEHLALSTPYGAAALQFLWRPPIDGAPLRVAYVPKGPVLDWSNLDLVDATLAAVEAEARARGCIFVKIDPDVNEDGLAGRLVLHALERRGWRHSQDQIQFKNTAFTDLTGGEAGVLAQMKNKWRYNVRLAEKRGIQVRLGDMADLDAFYALYAETGQRDGFLIRPFSYYRTTWETMVRAQAEAGNPAGGALLLAEHPDDVQPVAGLFLMRYGQRSWYFYGASSERHRRDMPNYLLQWEALRWSITQGCTVYDWWGAPTQLVDADDSLQGVWQFKQGFGAEFQPHIGAWDFPVSSGQYRLYTEAMPAVLGALRRLRR